MDLDRGTGYVGRINPLHALVGFVPIDRRFLVAGHVHGKVRFLHDSRVSFVGRGGLGRRSTAVRPLLERRLKAVISGQFYMAPPEPLSVGVPTRLFKKVQRTKDVVSA